MLTRSKDKTIISYPTTIPSLLDIYSQWNTYHFDTYTKSSSVDKLGAIGPNRLGTSIGLLNGTPVINDFAPYGYIRSFHNRHSSKFMIRALALQDLVSLNNAILSIEYVFKFQDWQGKNLLNISPTYNDGRLPVLATSVSPTSLLEVIGDASFYLNDLSETLVLTTQSSWFLSSNTTKIYRDRLKTLLPAIKAYCDWLASPILEGSTSPKTRSKTIADNDRRNPNRKLVQGLAHYRMGVYFNDERIKTLGRSLIQDGLRYQVNSYSDAIKPGSNFFLSTDSFYSSYLCYARTLDYLAQAPLGYGYFSENGGSDTSYNGVCAMQLGRLFCCIPDSEITFKKQIWEAFVKCVRWEANRIETTGNISTLDNTRVGDAGESYNGKTKAVNYIEVLPALDIYAVLSKDLDFMNSSVEKMLRYYTVKILQPLSMQFYTKGLQKIQSGEINLQSDNLRVALVQIASAGRYTPDLSNDEFYNQIPASSQPDIPELLQDQNFDGTKLTARNIFFDTVPPLPTNSTYQIGAIVIYKDSGDSNSSPLIAFSSNASGLPWASRNTDVLIDWSLLGYVFSL